ncbi:EAL domain-containing protein [Caballeronia sp. BR00000012568055]|uniref:putative bifunctional diguanylate cyclase/phosphodiesterase n=1 Tax=Caballeronia sp. BR00000012568055 TaxID=2918761 RepID=UPI0023F7BE0A|nr:EAL domain-containing protein [Caballeronia sp. BR00000012568055]
MPAASKTNRQLFKTTWPFVAVVASLLALVATSLSIMSSVRAYIGGESTWSKGQKDAVFYLIRYAQTGDQQAYRQYESAIAYPLYLKHARLALDRPDPDVEAAREALIASGVYPADVSSVIWVFRTFRRASYFEAAVTYWTRGDALVDQLAHVADELREAKASGAPGRLEVEQLTSEVWNINSAIAPISRAFADVLGAAFRQTALLLFVINVVVAMLLVSLSVWYARRFITARLASEHALRRSEARAKATLGSIGEAVISVGPTGLVEFINPAAERLFCRDAAACVNRPLTALVAIMREWDRRPVDLIEQALRGTEQTEPGADLILTNVRGQETVVQAITSVVHDTSDTITGVVLLLRNMAREREYVSNLSWQASHDGLTGLLNRTEFERRLHESLAEQAEHANSNHPTRPCMLMMLDLDQFKVVNDTYGHAAGDTMLREVSTLFRKCLRDEDSLARLGGDEFAALMSDCDERTAMNIAERLRQEVAAFQWSCETHTLSTSVSIGLVDLRGLDMETAMRFGDIACYLAKERGRDRVHLAVRGDKELNRHASAMSWCGRIKDALASNSFCLYAQEIRAIDSNHGHPRHVEVLLRMVGDGGKIIPPNFFMPAAERYGLMSAIDRWVVRAVFATLARSGNPEGIQYAINLSGASIGDERFLQFLTEQFELTGVTPSSICFEVTETTAVANLATAARFIRDLKNRGCKFSLDDFGAGMSSFGYLKHLPVDYIKIDGGFIKDMLKDAVNRDMVAAINDIGHSMGRLTIAEYVESEAILRALGSMGVDFVQGFHVGRPALWAQNVEFLAIT